MASPEAGRGNCLPYVLAPTSLSCESGEVLSRERTIEYICGVQITGWQTILSDHQVFNALSRNAARSINFTVIEKSLKNYHSTLTKKKIVVIETTV